MIANLQKTDSFAATALAVRGFRWRPEVGVTEISAPQRLAPYSLALEADVTTGGIIVASGRLVILHNPDGDEAWEGTTRFVSYVHADVEFEMATDPLLAEVAWSWLTEALGAQDADYVAASGTATSMTSHSFGDLDATPPRAEVELRCSWTAGRDGQDAQHIAAWQELLCQVAGLEPQIEGVASLPRRRGSR